MDFWNNYYLKKIEGDNELSDKNSTFSKYVYKYFNKNFHKSLIDLGCGNGRDSIFFEKKGLKVISVDISQTALDHITSDNIIKICSSMEKIHNIPIDICYTRFSLHSINLKKQDKVLDWCFKNLNKNGLLCIETRSINDPRFEKGKEVEDSAFIDTHYRRFTCLSQLNKKLIEKKFKIIKSEEEFYDSNFKEDKAVVNRIIAIKSD